MLCAGFVPMIWGYWGQQFPALPGHDTVLGFNEPNHPGQADLDPETAAWAWLELQVCRHRDYSKDATMVGFWEKSQKSDQMPYFGQNLVGF